MKTDGILLRALDGSNPLAFLAALGALRLVTLERPEAGIQMRWERYDGFWRPRLRGIDADEQELCRVMHQSGRWAPTKEFMRALGKNITVRRGEFQPFVAEACAGAGPNDRRAADFAAAFGCEICEDEKRGRIEYTDLCFITGSGHQDFLGTIAELAQKVTPGHLYDALFGEWNTEKKLSMRWDPLDASEYALQWDDPGPKGAWAVWGANRLASEALPLFPTAPVRDGLQTTGFRHSNRQDEFTWPIWEPFLECASVRSLVSLGILQGVVPENDSLRAMGVSELYRAQRVRIGQGANFKVSFRPARTV